MRFFPRFLLTLVAFGAFLAPALAESKLITDFTDPTQWLALDQKTETTVAADKPIPEGYFHVFKFTKGAPQAQLKWVKPASGIAVDTIPAGGPSSEGKGLHWTDTVSASRVVSLHLPTDWSGYKYVSFWVYNKVAGKTGFTMAVYSENFEATPKDDDYYQTKVMLDFTGWRHIEIPLSEFATTRNPIGWHKVDYIKLASSGFGLVAQPQTQLILSEIRMSNEPLRPDPLASVTVKFEKKAHPYLFGDQAFYRSIQQKVATERWAKAALEAVRASADSTFSDTFRVPTTGGGHYHDVTGASGDKDVAEEHYRVSRGARDAALMYAIEGGARYAEKVKQILLEYLALYPTYPLRDKYGNTIKEPTASSARALAQPMNEAKWITYLSWAYDIVYPLLTPAERQNLETKLFRPSAELIMLNNEKGHNHQSWHNEGVGVVGFLLQEPRYVKYAVYGLDNGFLYQMRASVTDDGMWYEGSGHYHFLTMEPLVMLSEAALSAGINLYDTKTPEGRVYRSMFLFPATYANPKFEMPLINDGKRVVLTENERARFLEIGYHRFQNDAEAGVLAPVLAASPRTTHEALVFGVAKLPENKGVVNRSTLLGGNIAVLRSPSERFVMTVNGRAYTGGHSHMDKLSITTFADGLDQSPDAGSVLYGMDEHKEFFIQTLAHNTVTVDEASQKFDVGADLLAFAHGPLVQGVSLQDKTSYPGSPLRRSVYLTDKYAFDVFRAESDINRTFHWVYRNLGELKTPAGMIFQPRTFPPANPEAGYKYLEGPRTSAAVPGPIDLFWDMYGGKKFTLRVLGTGETTKVITAQMLQSGENDQVSRLRFQGVLLERTDTWSTTFAAVHAFGLSPQDFTTVEVPLTSNGEVSDRKNSAAWRLGFGSVSDTVVYQIRSRGKNHALALEGVSTDADFVLVRRDKGQLTEVFVQGGTYLEVPEGKVTYTSEAKAVFHLTKKIGGFTLQADSVGLSVVGTAQFSVLR